MQPPGLPKFEPAATRQSRRSPVFAANDARLPRRRCCSSFSPMNQQRRRARHAPALHGAAGVRGRRAHVGGRRISEERSPSRSTRVGSPLFPFPKPGALAQSSSCSRRLGFVGVSSNVTGEGRETHARLARRGPSRSTSRAVSGARSRRQAGQNAHLRWPACRYTSAMRPRADDRKRAPSLLRLMLDRLLGYRAVVVVLDTRIRSDPVSSLQTPEPFAAVAR